MPRSLHSENYRTLTAILLEARKSAGLTQQQVADRLGKPQSFVAKVEGGERRIDLIEFIELSRAIDTPPEALLATVLIATERGKKSGR